MFHTTRRQALVQRICHTRLVFIVFFNELNPADRCAKA